MLGYEFSVPKAGDYEIWNRVGFDSIRTQFAWRLDGGAWTNIEHDAPTIDLMELGEWCEISWLKMGRQPLSAGRHTLEIKVTAQERRRLESLIELVYASDALCIYGGEFHPYSKFKPDENSQSEKDTGAAKTVVTVADPSRARAQHSSESRKAPGKSPGMTNSCPDRSSSRSPHCRSIQSGWRSKCRPIRKSRERI